VGSGDVASALTYLISGRGKPPTFTPVLELRILGPNGVVFADGAGPSILKLAENLPQGTYTWEVSGRVSASFTLQVTYTAP